MKSTERGKSVLLAILLVVLVEWNDFQQSLEKGFLVRKKSISRFKKIEPRYLSEVVIPPKVQVADRNR